MNLDMLLQTTDGATGPEIAAVVSMAAMAVIKEQMAARGKGKLRVRMAHLEGAAKDQEEK